MDGVSGNDSETNVNPSVTNIGLLSGIVVSATIAASAVSPYGVNPTHQNISQSAKLSNSGSYRVQERFGASDGQGAGKANILEANVRSITREELDAKLSRNKAETEVISSSMKTEMANFRTSYLESFRDISNTLNSINAKTDATEKRLTQSQWIISLVISISALTLSAVIFFSNKATTRPVMQQPSTVVINTSSTEKATLEKEKIPEKSANQNNTQ